MRWREVSLLFALSLLSFFYPFLLFLLSLGFSMPLRNVAFFQNCEVVLALCVLACLFPIMTSRSSSLSRWGGKKGKKSYEMKRNENKHEQK